MGLEEELKPRIFLTSSDNQDVEVVRHGVGHVE
jgi:hypothetical protein